jgi:phytoene/squalene synthetase
MPDDLQDLLEKDRDARAFFASLPMFARDQVVARSRQITNKEDLSGIANQAMHDAFQLDQYRTMFEDETDSDIDLI